MSQGFSDFILIFDGKNHVGAIVEVNLISILVSRGISEENLKYRNAKARRMKSELTCRPSGHGGKSQYRRSILFPHSWPPLLAGERIFRVLSWMLSSPHVFAHGVQSPHSDIWQSIAAGKNKMEISKETDEQSISAYIWFSLRFSVTLILRENNDLSS